MKLILKIFKLAFNYLKYNKLMSAILIVCITISIFIPMFTVKISNVADEVLSSRAAQTPSAQRAPSSALLSRTARLIRSAGWSPCSPRIST